MLRRIAHVFSANYVAHGACLQIRRRNARSQTLISCLVQMVRKGTAKIHGTERCQIAAAVRRVSDLLCMRDPVRTSPQGSMNEHLERNPQRTVRRQCLWRRRTLGGRPGKDSVASSRGIRLTIRPFATTARRAGLRRSASIGVAASSTTSDARLPGAMP